MSHKDIHYTLEFFSYWHCSSGLAAGADVDTLVVKDDDGLPFVPGKTIKGLVKCAFVDLLEAIGTDEKGICEVSTSLFGNEGGLTSPMFFSDATLQEQESIRRLGLACQLFNTVSNTRIDDQGIAHDTSLRRTEVVIPCKLSGCILNVPFDYVNSVCDALRSIKVLGTNRSRGFGRCQFTPKED